LLKKYVNTMRTKRVFNTVELLAVAKEVKIELSESENPPLEGREAFYWLNWFFNLE
jgi:hypothetical protein